MPVTLGISHFDILAFFKELLFLVKFINSILREKRFESLSYGFKRYAFASILICTSNTNLSQCFKYQISVIYWSAKLYTKYRMHGDI